MNFQCQRFKIFSSLSSFFQIINLITPFILSICANESVYASTYLPDSINYHGGKERMHDEAWEMVERKGNQFMVNGRPFYINGFNTYWLMILAVDQSTKAKVTEVFQQASAIGLTVCRTWGFNDGQWRALQKSPSTYDEDVFKALDFVVSEARKHNIRLILPLVNNWDAYGGKSQYVKWGNNASGLNLTSDDDFFTDQTIKGYYKTHVKTVLNRVNTISNITYKDDETIFAWELMNEPRCLSDPSGDKLQTWIEEMAFYVKSIDRKHLLGTGLEGFYGPSTPDKLRFNPNTFAGQVGTDFIKNHQVLGIDFASAHMYPGSWLSNSTPETYIQFVRTWMQSHIDDADNTLNMPMIFGEFGVSLKDANFNHTYRDMFMDTVYKTMLNSTKRGGSGGGCLVWQLSPFTESQKERIGLKSISRNDNPSVVVGYSYEHSQSLILRKQSD